MMEGSVISRPCISLFDQEIRDLMRDVRVVGRDIRSTGNYGNSIQTVESTGKGSVSGSDTEAIEKTGMTCSVCLVVFESVEIQRQHFKLDWHRFNLKQKLLDKPILSEEAFEETISGEVSSISGSDSDTDSDEDLTLESSQLATSSIIPLSEETSHVRPGPTGRHQPRVVFVSGSGDVLSVYRSVLYSVKNIPSTTESLRTLFTDLPKKRYWMILMTAGGHFAGAVFNGREVVSHKTFHRYTVRAKRGTAQGARDTQQGGKQPKSAGASLRRHNEAALVQEVQDLIEAWSHHVEQCDRIFLRAPVYNRSIFFGGKKPPFRKDDVRVRTIPFPTRRPTFNEVKRVHQELSSVQLLGKESDSALQDLFNELTETKTRDLPSSEEDRTRLWQEKHALDTTSKKDEDQNTLKETDLTLNKTDCTEDKENEALTNRPLEIPKKSRRKKAKGKKVELVDTLHNGEKVSSEQHTWNRLYCAIVSGNNEVISSLLGVSISDTTKENPQSEEPLPRALQLEKEAKEDKGSSLALSEETIPNKDLAGKCLLVENGTDGSKGTCQGCERNGELRSSECSSQESALPKERNNVLRIEENEPTDSKHGMCEHEKTNSTAEYSLCHQSSSEPADDRDIPGNNGDKTTGISEVINARFGEGGDTLLHVASRSSRTEIVGVLLEVGADPAVKDDKGRTPYIVAGSKETRNEFRRFMASFPDRFNYAKAQIPSALTQEMQSEKEKKNAERKKAQKKAQKQRNKEQKTSQRKKDEEEKEKQAYQSLSDREKRAFAAEKRFAQQQAVKQAGNSPCCAWCSKSLDGQVPFERLTYKYCGTACVKAHRLDMEAQQR